MTNEEAMKYLKDPMSYTYEGIPVDMNKEDEAVYLAISALEKQIPKKPKTRFEKIPNGKQEWFCPSCESKLYEISEGIMYGHEADFCEDCGQAIDWGRE